MKMYILVKEDVRLGLAAVSIAHAAMAAYLAYKDTPEVKEWLAGPFYKVVCKVTAQEMEQAKDAGDYVRITDSNYADGTVIIALAFKPREEYPKAFKYFKLFK